MAGIEKAPYINWREFSEKADAIYARLRSELERDHWGEILIIEPDSGDYFLAKEPKEAERKFYEKHPGELFVRLRVGKLAVHRLPGRARPIGLKRRGF